MRTSSRLRNGVGASEVRLSRWRFVLWGCGEGLSWSSRVAEGGGCGWTGDRGLAIGCGRMVLRVGEWVRALAGLVYARGDVLVISCG